MASLEICKYPHQILRKKCMNVDRMDRHVRKLIDDMAETMYQAPGIGLAANQVGQPLRILVVDLQKPEDNHGLIVLINPRILEARGEITYEEGCLSVPDYYAPVKRYGDIRVQGLNEDMKPVEIQASGLLAVVLQHEMDHLDGKLFIDRLGPISRDIFKRKWKKKHKEGQA